MASYGVVRRTKYGEHYIEPDYRRIDTAARIEWAPINMNTWIHQKRDDFHGR